MQVSNEPHWFDHEKHDECNLTYCITTWMGVKYRLTFDLDNLFCQVVEQ